jgi:hypothetical protein
VSEALVTDEYRAEQERMHRDVPDYGVECLKYVDTIARIIIEQRLTTMLDYGAGKGRIVPALGKVINATPYAGEVSLELSLYDPGVPEIAELPGPAQLVTCIDVLEHVEPQFTINVLNDIRRCTEQLAFITIGLQPAAKVLSDGRNAHINLRSADEWTGMLLKHFSLVYCINKGRSLVFLGKAK